MCNVLLRRSRRNQEQFEKSPCEHHRTVYDRHIGGQGAEICVLSYPKSLAKISN